MLGPVRVRGHADHQQRRPPLGDQPPDGGEARPVLRRGDGGQGMRDPGLEIADRDAGALGAEIKRENGSRSREKREA
jgi:hypothetical protein